MFLVKPEIAVLSKQLFLVLLEADIAAAIENTVQEVKLLVSPPNELIPHPIIDVE